MAELDRGHLPALLESVSIKYINGAFKINRIYPLVHVKKSSDKILVDDKGNIYTLHDTYRGEDGRSNYVNFGEQTLEYACKNHALHTYVSDKLLKNNDFPYNPMIRRTEGLTEKILLDREARGVEFAGDSANYVFTTDIAGKWGDPTTSNVPKDVDEAKAQMLIPPNVFAVGMLDYLKISQDPHFAAYVSGGATPDNPALVRPEVMAVLLGVKEVVIFEAQYRSNPNEPEASGTWTRLWNNFAGLYYVEGLGEEEYVPEIDMTTFAIMPSWDPDQQSRSTRVNTDYNTERDGGSQFIEVEEDVDIAQAIPEAGFLFQFITTASP